MNKGKKQPGTVGLDAKCIELTLPPIVHGTIEQNPDSLGQLDEMLKRRGIDLEVPLKNILSSRVGDAGAHESSDESHMVFLLNIPICRIEGDEPEHTIHRAFLMLGGPLKLGVDIGALFLHENKYFNAAGLLNSAPSKNWHNRAIFPMSVLHQNSVIAARQQSGIEDPGPEGILIGVGSLGSAMLNLWGRSGWGKWTVIDKDHIKPHNLSRHVADLNQIGKTKVSVVAELHTAAIGDGSVIPLFGDACDVDNDDSMLACFQAAKLIVDASTTLEYPRLSSTKPELPRHISTFVTPAGNAAVLLAEDAGRKIKLHTLEAQYYRALIQNDWGEHHLSENLGTYWSGAGCRDISTVMPYSRIMAHASILAEQVPLVASQPGAKIRIWERNADVASIQVHDVVACSDRCIKSGRLNLFIDAGLEEQLRDIRRKNLPNETGGILLGYYDFNIDAIVVVCGAPAPSDSKSSPGSFERGTVGVVEMVKSAEKRTANVVSYIGEWHSHPPGHSASPSGDDIIQLTYLVLGMADEGLPGLQLIVGENDIQIYQGVVLS